MTQIIDDKSSNYSKTPGWVCQSGKGYGNTFCTANLSTAEIAAAWNFTVTPNKKYQIAVTYVVDNAPKGVNYTQKSAFGGVGLNGVAAPAGDTGGVTGVGSGVGVTYVNIYSATSFKSVGSFVLGPVMPQATNPSSGQLIVIVGLQGVMGKDGSTFNQGVAAVYTLPEGGWQANNLSTWGYNHADPKNNLVGIYVLKAPGSPTHCSEIVSPSTNAYQSLKAGVDASQVNFAGNTSGSFNNQTGAAVFRDAGNIAGNTFTPMVDIFNPSGNSLAASFGRTTNGTSGFVLPGLVADFSTTSQNSFNPNFDITTDINNLTVANNFFADWSDLPPVILPDGTNLPGTNLLNDMFAGWATNFASTGDITTDYAPKDASTGDFPGASTAASLFAPTLGTNSLSLNATNAVYSIFDGGRLVTTVTINQQDIPNEFTDAGFGWKNLGIVNITTNKLKVRLSNQQANGQIVADACRIQWPA